MLGASFGPEQVGIGQVGLGQGLELKSVGPLAFNSDGVLFIGDPMAAAIYAVEMGEASEGKEGDIEQRTYQVAGLDKKIAAALGVTPEDILLHDMAVNPKSGSLVLSVSRGKGPDAIPVLLQISEDSQIQEFELATAKFTKAELPNAPGPDAKDRRGNAKRAFSITDLAFINNQVVIAGLSNEQFESNLRAVTYPFSTTPSGTAVEVYHGAHGKYETNAPIRTFTSIMIDNEPSVIAAYTCTPLVRFPMSQLTEGDKIQGTTVAELGNWNQPLDMIVYERDGKEYILMANSARGMMKIDTTDIGREVGISEPVSGGGVAGQKFELVEALKTAVQLVRLNSMHAVAVVKNEDGSVDLVTFKLP
jgi:hypothetical protein